MNRGPPQIFSVSFLILWFLAVASSSGVFALLQAYAFLQYLKDRLTRQEFQTLFLLGVSLAAGVVFLTVIYLTYTGLYVVKHVDHQAKRKWLIDYFI